MIQPGTLQRWRIGEALRADRLNQPVDKLNRMAGVGPAQQVIGHPIPEAVDGRPTRFVITNASDFGDYLVCSTPSGVSDVYVAKPWGLRRTPFDDMPPRNDMTYAYTSNTRRIATLTVGEETETENQVINPPWLVDDEILANLVNGGTGVTALLPDGEEVEVRWEARDHGHEWAEEDG
jgi:hypothetical protein